MIKKLIVNIPALIFAVLVAWVVLSWVDVVADNNTARPVHNKYNAFVLLSGGETK